MSEEPEVYFDGTRWFAKTKGVAACGPTKEAAIAKWKEGKMAQQIGIDAYVKLLDSKERH